MSRPPAGSIAADLHPPAAGEAPPTMADSALREALATTPAAEGRLRAFDAAQTVGQALTAWFGQRPSAPLDALARALNADIAQIDAAVEAQVNAILHHPAFQQLEAGWRGVHYLVRSAQAYAGGGAVKIRILNVSWKEVLRDLDRATEFDQSQLFRKIYENEFGTPGGEPFGAMIGNYEIHPRPSPDHPSDDIAGLVGLSQIAAASFCPFVAGANPSLFGLNSYHELEKVENLERGFDQPEFIKWRAFRDTDDARYVALTLPRVLMRAPYEAWSTRPDGFCFHEDVSGRDLDKYLWGNAAFALGEVLVRAYATSGWFAEIRGVTRDVSGGGLVQNLPVHCFGTDKPGVAAKTSTETIIPEALESRLSALGFLSLCHCHDTELSAFYSSPSVQKPRAYDRDEATQNARLSAMLHYMFCVSRFAHYLKVLARDRVGSFTEPEVCANQLREWIMRYVTPDDRASPEVKARRPLREADVQVLADPGKAGSFLCTFRLVPHFQFDQINASIQLRTRIAAKGIT